MQLSLARSLAVLVAALCLLLPPASRAQVLSGGSDLLRPHSKRSFLALKCRGVFNKAAFHELNAVCQECYTIYKEPELHGLCRSDCFTTEYFQGCLQALLRIEESEKFDSYIQKISGKK